MKASWVRWISVIMLIGATIISAVAGNPDGALVLILCTLAGYLVVGKACGVLMNRNVVFFLGLLLFLILLVYHLMFDLSEVQSYIADELAVRRRIICYGALLTQVMLVGGMLGLFRDRKSVAPAQRGHQLASVKLAHLVTIAWLPLILNLLLYIFVFRGRAYVDIHTSGQGAPGLVLKTIYFTYGAMILIGMKSQASEVGYRSTIWILMGFCVVYGVLLNLRSPLLAAMLLFVFFYGQRISGKTLAISIVAVVVMFAAIGVVRDPSGAREGLAAGIASAIFGLGEFVDALRFAMDGGGLRSSSWGMGILGSLLGISEPVANSYARAIAPEYFEEGGGFGFFILADFVVNFGVNGALVVAGVVGYVLTRQYYSHRPIFFLIIPSILYANAFAMVRNDLGSTLRGVVYTLFATLIVRQVLRVQASRQ